MTSYQAPFLLFNAHLETIFPALTRTVALSFSKKERIPTPDDDFLDLDWYNQGAQKVVIISHGLEGNSQRAYVKGMARIFYQNGFDVMAWNYRGCSDEMNRQLRFYHSGATDDLHTVVTHACAKDYSAVYLIGFSLGGNLTLKYLGEQESSIHQKVKRAVVFSAPVHLHSSCIQISKPQNILYALRFIRSLKKKVTQKAKFLDDLDIKGIEKIKTLIDFDERYTAPLHGFTSALDYYAQCSSIHFIEKIAIPTLIINAKNDPFLSPQCYPSPDNGNLKMLYPKKGGHVGFTSLNNNGIYWSEQQAVNFVHSKNV